MNILVIAEHDNKHLKSASLATLSAGINLLEHVDTDSKDINLDVFLAGNFETAVLATITKQLTDLRLLNKIIIANDKIYEYNLAEDLCDLLLEIAKNYQYILLPATTFGKNLAPRLAALLDINPLSDIIEILNKDTFKRPIYAGNAIATVKLHDSIKLLTIRTTCFSNLNSNKITNNSASLVELDAAKFTSKKLTKFVKYELSNSERPELSVAKIVVSGGRGVGSKENFKLINDLADKLNAAVGASRAAVDAGFVPNDCQVGQTGKVVAPDLYIAVGISGAIQHMAGIRDSKIIVAINKDEEAPIFKIADYALAGDLFEILPELTNKIAALEK